MTDINGPAADAAGPLRSAGVLLVPVGVNEAVGRELAGGGGPVEELENGCPLAERLCGEFAVRVVKRVDRNRLRRELERLVRPGDGARKRPCLAELVVKLR